MKKVLAIVLITTVGLSTLLAKGISQGTQRNSNVKSQNVRTTTYNTNNNISRNKYIECEYDGTGIRRNASIEFGGNRQNLSTQSNLNYSRFQSTNNQLNQSGMRTNNSGRMGNNVNQLRNTADCINLENEELYQRNYRNSQAINSSNRQETVEQLRIYLQSKINAEV